MHSNPNNIPNISAKKIRLINENLFNYNAPFLYDTYKCMYYKNKCPHHMYKYTIKLYISSRLNKNIIIINGNNLIDRIHDKIFVDSLVT